MLIPIPFKPLSTIRHGASSSYDHLSTACRFVALYTPKLKRMPVLKGSIVLTLFPRPKLEKFFIAMN